MRRPLALLAVVILLAGCGATPTSAPTLVSFTPTSAVAATATAVEATATPVAAVASPTGSGQGGSVKKIIATAPPTAPAIAPSATGAGGNIGATTPTAAAAPAETAVPQPPATAVPAAPVPAPTATPVPSSAYAVSPYFDEAAFKEWDVPVPYGYTAETGKNTLGLPVDAGTWTQLARQWFGPGGDAVCTNQDSLMVWQADTRQVSYLYQGSGGSSSDCYPDPWYWYQDTYQQGEPNNEGEQAPAGQYVPLFGFGKVWREIRAEPNARLGFATTEEQHTEGMVQRFENGTAYYLQDTASIYVLFDQFRRIGRSGEEFTSLTWFAVQ
ncbi:MAG: hypothetical protein ACYC5O_10370 [Anaerolineae bacterium]